MNLEEKLANLPIADDMFFELSKNDKKFGDLSARIAIRLREERISRDLTQKEFAELMNVTQAMVSKWESGSYNFTIETLAQIFQELAVPFDVAFEEKKKSKLYNMNDYTSQRQKWSIGYLLDDSKENPVVRGA